MSVTTISFLNILDGDLNAPKPYIDFRTKNMAFVFQKPANVDILGINNFNITDGNFTTLPSVAIIPDVDDANKCTLNWTKLNSLWTIPSGIMPYVSKFTYNSNQYFAVFGAFTSDGGFNSTIGTGKDVIVTLDPGVTNPVIFTNVRIESIPYKQPCNIVREYYNSDGIVSINLT